MLRHLIGLPAGLAAAPAMWAALAWSAQRVSTTVDGGEGFAPPALTAVGMLMAVGVACGFLAGARISPLAAFAGGGLLLGYALWPVMAPGTVDPALPGWIPDDSLFHPRGPGLLLALPLGTLLFISGIVPSRWRSRRAPVEPVDAGPPAAGGAVGPRAEHGREPVRPGEPTDAPDGPDPAGPPVDPERTTTPMRRRRIGRPRRRATASERADDTVEFQRGRG